MAIYNTPWTPSERNGGTIRCVSLELSESVERKNVVFDAMDLDNAGQLGMSADGEEEQRLPWSPPVLQGGR